MERLSHRPPCTRSKSLFHGRTCGVLALALVQEEFRLVHTCQSKGGLAGPPEASRLSLAVKREQIYSKLTGPTLVQSLKDRRRHRPRADRLMCWGELRGPAKVRAVLPTTLSQVRFE